MYGLAQVPVTERTMLEKDEALKAANMATGRLGGRYVGKNRKWQGIPSLTRTRGGRLYVCFYSGGEGEGAENYVLLKKSDDDGKTWSEPVLAIDPAGNVRAFDPCLWTAPDGRVFLFWAAELRLALTGEPGAGMPHRGTDARRPEWSAPSVSGWSDAEQADSAAYRRMAPADQPMESDSLGI